MYQLNKQHRSPKTSNNNNKSRTRIQHGGYSCSYHQRKSVNAVDLRNTLYSISTSKICSATTKQILNSQMLRQWSKLVSCTVPSLLPCRDQVAMPRAICSFCAQHTQLLPKGHHLLIHWFSQTGKKSSTTVQVLEAHLGKDAFVWICFFHRAPTLVDFALIYLASYKLHGKTE